MKRLLVITALSASAAACGGLETGNGQGPDGPKATTVTLEMALMATETLEEHPVARDSDGRLLDIASARVHVRRIELKLPEGMTCTGIEGLEPPSVAADNATASPTWVNVCMGNNVRMEGPWVVDLLTGEWTPPLEPVAVPAAAYRRADVRLEPANPADGLVVASDPLAYRTIAASGRLDTANGFVPYRLELSFQDEARFESESPGGIEVLEGDMASLWLLMDVGTWFADLPVSFCADKGQLPVEDGTVLLSDAPGACQSVENSVRDAIKASGLLTGEAP